MKITDTIGTATFLLRVGSRVIDTYTLGFDYDENKTTALGKARDLLNTVAAINGWNVYDIYIRDAK